jgi:hypothetical protein
MFSFYVKKVNHNIHLQENRRYWSKSPILHCITLTPGRTDFLIFIASVRAEKSLKTNWASKIVIKIAIQEQIKVDRAWDGQLTDQFVSRHFFKFRAKTRVKWQSGHRVSRTEDSEFESPPNLTWTLSWHRRLANINPSHILGCDDQRHIVSW